MPIWPSARKKGGSILGRINRSISWHSSPFVLVCTRVVSQCVAALSGVHTGSTGSRGVGRVMVKGDMTRNSAT
jgi:hypothetical protein